MGHVCDVFLLNIFDKHKNYVFIIIIMNGSLKLLWIKILHIFSLVVCIHLTSGFDELA